MIAEKRFFPFLSFPFPFLSFPFLSFPFPFLSFPFLSFPFPDFKWQWVTVDFITDLSESRPYGHCGFVDRSSKMVHFSLCWNDMGAEEFAQILVRDVFRLHGDPQFLGSDRDTLRTSKFFAKASESLRLKRRLSTASHPQTDGQTERADRTLEDMLRHFIYPAQNDWDVRLPCCEVAIDIAGNRAVGSILFFLNYGSHPRTSVDVDFVTPLPAADALRSGSRRQ